ncbi:ATP-dependent dethiobiotin synthetase BioD [Pantoea sp. Bo_2]|uniref:ATP-dependent dethiobiotin synthetase BioD n=1 Tax=Candidatus Pantoea gossypiicola TaxID=2608008 RepID=A0AB34CW10_9GAMM|nr:MULTISPECIES: dethiobiotin synthase [Pantoea]KAA5933082.1 ATP-dependent dethiobiotin synthetase BioD [Pantoea sp. VH_8]KAA5937869.1 ATP-dependent dethiobiotin synthetase BioD [Pantoea sp. VH_4]KAA5950346.1 ATP-dependent dethiobiotin synthetase BioD [Pantoea sp. VH_3]KAA5955718.1 ATP-dependent dethiobiotin synthetase BioD [Pantoea sp. VH_25]KAA5960119.1 ATP-dependent dethiobiotin synthetase BioD [Pantoea sp. VH_24]
MNRLFVTGTDTAVGKTVVSCALLQSFIQSGQSAVGFKPVARCAVKTADGLRNKDAQVLQSASSIDLAYQAINPLAFQEEEICTHPGQIIDYGMLTRGLASLTQQADRVVVEGTGGWRSLMNDGCPLSCWVVEQQLPVVLVVGIQSGCISHALLTAEAITRDGLPLVGWVANRINPGLAQYSDIIEILREKIDAPLLGELPYLPRAEQRDLTPWMDISLLEQDALHAVSAKIA